ncbi:MAG: histidinol dehydrogenase [Planctomycetota bacterium]|jgi:histidinol dehydrogenase
MLTRLDTKSLDFPSRLEALRKKLSPDGNVVSERSAKLTLSLFGEPLSPQQVVERICTEVREGGTPAVLKYARALDNPGMESSGFRVPLETMAQAHRLAAPEFLNAVRAIRSNIERFQSAILHKDVQVSDDFGQILKQRYTPLSRIGICVPGGAAAYPSTVLMTAVPAQVAGVKQIAIMAPPTPFGAYNTEVLATCYELGIQEVYAVGGAQGIASLAYGIPEIPAVDMIVGPGNLFVALAKKLVYGTVAIDSIAGPSEVVVIADGSTKPANAASDLIAQAEHSPGSSIVLSANGEMLDRIDREIQVQLQTLERADLARSSLIEFGASIRCGSDQEVIDLCDRLAPEHLQISVDDPDRYSDRIRNAGAIFKGHYSPVALGDYAAGPSHVLPTGGTARWASGLSANHFLRSYSEVEFTLDGLRAIEPHVSQLADKEGLTAHRQSVKVRLV